MGILYGTDPIKSGKTVARSLKYGNNNGFRPDMLEADYAKGKEDYDNEEITVDNRNWFEKRADANAKWGENLKFDNAVPRFFNDVGVDQTKLASNFSKVFTGNGVTSAPRKDINAEVDKNTSGTRVSAAKNIGTEFLMEAAGIKAGGLVMKAIAPLISKIPVNRITGKVTDAVGDMKSAIEKSRSKISSKNITDGKGTSKATAARNIGEGNDFSTNWYNSASFRDRVVNPKNADSSGEYVYNKLVGDIEDTRYLMKDGREMSFGDVVNGGQDALSSLTKEAYERVLVNYSKREQLVQGLLRSTDDDYRLLMDRVGKDQHKSRPATAEETIRGKKENFSGESSFNYDTKKADNIVLNGSDLTTVHEGNHGLTGGNWFIPTAAREVIDRLTDVSRKIVPDFDYFTKPTEVYARIMEIRKKGSLKPGEEVTMDQLKNIMRETDFNLAQLKKFYSPKSILKLLNTLPAAAGVNAAIGNKEEGEGIIYNKGN